MKSSLGRFATNRYLSIRWKLVLPLALVILILLLLSPLVSRLISGRVEQEADRRLGESANSVEGLFENSQYLATSGAGLVSTQPEILQAFNEPDKPYQDAVLKLKESLRLQELSLYPASFNANDPALFYGGPPVTRRLQVSEDTTRTRNSLLLKAIQEGVSTSAVVIAPQGSQILAVAPVYAQDGTTVAGAVLASFYMDEAFIKNISNIIGADIAIVKDNKVIVSSISPDSNYERPVIDGTLASLGTISETITYRNGQQDRLLGKPLIVSGRTQGYVLVAQPIAELLAVSQSIQAILLVFGLVFAITTLWFWIAALLTFTRPLSQLTEAITRVREGELNQAVEIPYVVFKDEITLLGDHFNRMTTDLRDLYTSLEDRVRQRTEELAEARDQAVAANKSKTEFVSVVSHELKIPMTSIKGYSDLMIAGATGPISDKQMEFLKTIRNNVSRMAILVSDLADISRIESGNLRLEPTLVDAKSVIEDAIKLAKNQIDQKNQTLQVEIPDDLPRVLYDKNRLSQVMTNLISNANKYTQEGGKVVVQAKRTTHACDGQEPQDVIQVKVQDNGFGMSPEDQTKLFNKFFRSPDDQVRAAPGTGLGLSITKNLIELQKGCIWFESEYRKGTAFYFTIPVTGQPEK
jgi:signal transduction histidine kinase